MNTLTEIKNGQKINIDKIIDGNITLHPQISKWRDAYTVDLNLLNSIEKTGQFQDTIFRSLGDNRFELIAGARRYLHQKLLGTKWEDIPKKILELNDKEAYEMAASENFFRLNLNKWEETRVIYDLLTKAKIPVKDLAERLGVSESYITNRRTLMKLPENIRKKFEELNVPVGYADPIMKLSKYPEAQKALVKEIEEGLKKNYGGIRKVEAANEFVDRAIKKINDTEELLKKYGACPKCGGKNISESSWGDKNKLVCKECEHEWNRETKEPWEYYRLKQQAQEMGFEIEEESPEKLKLTPKEASEILKEEIIKQEEEVDGGKLPENFRSNLPLDQIILPIIRDNIQKISVRGDTVEIELIEDSELYFRGHKKDYKSGEKARVEMSGGWNTEEAIEKLHGFYNNLAKATEA